MAKSLRIFDGPRCFHKDLISPSDSDHYADTHLLRITTELWEMLAGGAFILRMI